MVFTEHDRRRIIKISREKDITMGPQATEWGHDVRLYSNVINLN